ncbi:branched-chain amino acid ABC transporter permease [Bosea sp. BH3]|uniref:branched-chain amino acid ABC transporter permease n=1 Tax=Bosea sp. BH3 TaxID=2871701 RepID=UPI0021CB5943|nr:branched-chain amino acid ABC transporter permease [Bosea sp. BH3]MCU4180443.1 branched-chain amino acid ABC transporter permease [Bosea sp. BH3]
MSPFLAEFVQLLLNGVMAGAILAVPALGLTAMFAVLRFPNFALASHATAGAFAGYVANVSFGLPLIPSLVFAFFFAGLLGLVSDEVVLKPFRAMGAITTAIGSIALTIAIENLIRFVFANELRGYDLPIARDMIVGGVRIGPQQMQNLAISVVIMGLVFAFLTFTRMGKAMRAVADNPMLADIKGINADTVARIVSFGGMGLAGLGGMLIGLDTSIDPLTGFRAMLSVFAAAVVGGLGSLPGAIVGALVVGIGEELCLLVLSPSYRSAVGFLAILLVLVLRPRGILGQRAY